MQGGKPCKVTLNENNFFGNPGRFIVFSMITNIYNDNAMTAAVKYTDAPMLTRVWQEVEYRIDVCRVTRGAHIEHL
jgi:hypothetical protein